MAKKKDYNDLFGDDEIVKPQNAFDELLNSSAVHTRGLAAGDRFRGEVLAVNGLEAFISTGTPTDAVMPFMKEEGKEPPKAGDVVDVIVVRARESEILVKQVGSRGATAEADSLEDAYDMELPVEGVVLEEVKGGFRVKVQGMKAFCPISQIDYRCVDPKSYIGKKYEFIITKYERGRDLVVSRRKILDQQKAVGEGDFLRDAEPGSIHEATVFRLEKYGAFVRLKNGVEGLIPIQELAWGRINRPEEAVQMDQTVQVKLLSAVEDGNRLKVSFSLKQGGAVDDPWTSIEQTFPVGAMFDGTVEHKEPFGIFVRIAMGITGLLPRSAWRDAEDSKDWENKRKGDSVKVRIERIDTDNRKLSFSLPRDADDETWRDHAAAKAPAGGAGKTAGFGTFGDLLKGVKDK